MNTAKFKNIQVKKNSLLEKNNKRALQKAELIKQELFYNKKYNLFNDGLNLI